MQTNHKGSARISKIARAAAIGAGLLGIASWYRYVPPSPSPDEGQGTSFLLDRYLPNA